MVVFSQCIDCKNYIEKKGDIFCCKAFLEGIPDDVFWNKKYHVEHIEGDNGYQFENIDKSTSQKQGDF